MRTLNCLIVAFVLAVCAPAQAERVIWHPTVHYSLLQKLNVLWWFGNDQCGPTDTFTYCYVRNPLSNFTRYVIGVADQQHYVTGRHPVMTNERSDLGQTGWQYAVSQPVFPLPYYNLPWLSYSGQNVVWYAGWEPWGQFAIKFNILNSPFQLLVRHKQVRRRHK